MRIRRSFAAFVCTLTMALAVGQADDKTGGMTYQLPKDPKAVIISFDYAGGFTPPRKKDAPALSILRDGTVLMPDRFGASKDVTGKISESELQGLLRLAIETNRFFDYSVDDVKQKIKKAEAGMGFVPRIADAPSSVIEIRIEGKSHKVSQYALSHAVRQYPAVKELQQLHAVQQRLNRVMNVTRIGGEKQLQKMLKLANDALKKQEPKAKPFVADELQGASIRRDGTTYVTFSRYGRTPDGKINYRKFVNASIQIPKGGEPKVTVRAKL